MLSSRQPYGWVPEMNESQIPNVCADDQEDESGIEALSEDSDELLHAQCERDRAYAEQAQSQLDAFYRELSYANKEKRMHRTPEDVLTGGLRAVLRKLKMLEIDSIDARVIALRAINTGTWDRQRTIVELHKIWRWLKIGLGVLGATVLVSMIMWSIILYRAFS